MYDDPQPIRAWPEIHRDPKDNFPDRVDLLMWTGDEDGNTWCHAYGLRTPRFLCLESLVAQQKALEHILAQQGIPLVRPSPEDYPIESDDYSDSVCE